MSSHATDLAVCVVVLAILIGGCVRAWVLNLRERKAAREATKRDRLNQIIAMGYGYSLIEGWIDERGNLIERVGDWDDIR